jgi:xanthine dehydrogenase accessory factor
LQKLYLPIGIPIKSITPEEIGISIAAQLIDIKNNNKTHNNKIQTNL